ncbi:hypothetical protein [Herbiconiux sp.]|uniref:IS1096 element passenger TnpR family protein n=1 Tax=Herbiconiux sp. TaxID=1871186 RepID=UPI0025BF93DD|nr:hypothetical protein [Herbiconiux sp.]
MSTKRRPGGRRPSTGRSETGTTALLVRFERWYAQHAASVDGHDHASAPETTALLGKLFELSSRRLHEPVVEVLDPLLAAVEADPELAPRLPEVIETLEHYLDFAVETGAWEGTDAQIDASSDLLEDAYDISTRLLLHLIDALEDVDDVPRAEERAAFEGLASAISTPEQLTERLREVLRSAEGDAASEPRALAQERVLGLLCVAANPLLLPSTPVEQIVELLDIAAGAAGTLSGEADGETDRMLGELTSDGILTLIGPAGDSRYEAPTGLRAALADAIDDIADELGLFDDGRNPHQPGTVLGLRVDVQGSEPAVWRSLLLEADADLGELHLAVQLSLDWPNAESHGFTAASEPDEVYTSADRIADEPDDERLVDENEVEVGELLAELGDDLHYEYGDEEPRRVAIRLERVEPAGDGGGSGDRSLPRCDDTSPETDVTAADALLAPLRLR